MLGDDLAAERSQELNIGHIDISIADGLDDEPARDARLAQAAAGLGQLGRDQPQLAHLAKESAVDAALLLAFLILWCDPLARKAVRSRQEGTLLVGQPGFHRSSRRAVVII